LGFFHSLIRGAKLGMPASAIAQNWSYICKPNNCSNKKFDHGFSAY
jgi:hypothetical protein